MDTKYLKCMACRLFGSAINFYGGPGEASHKTFVKAPGLKTQQRVSEFASQTAGQYYNTMVMRKAARHVDIRLASERVSYEPNDLDVHDEQMYIM